MALKLAGSFIVVVSLYAYGWYMAQYTKKRRDEIAEFKKAFLLFSGETLYTGGVLWEVFESIGERCTGRAAEVFVKASRLLYGKGADCAFTAWEEAVDTTLKDSFMEDEDIENIKAFGRCLGFCDEMSQLSNAKLTISYIDEKSTELKDAYTEQKKLYKSLGAMAGLLIAIVVF